MEVVIGFEVKGVVGSEVEVCFDEVEKVVFGGIVEFECF